MNESTLFSTISSAAELVKLLVNERDRQKSAAIQIDLTNKITEAQLQLTQVLNSVVEKDGLIQTLMERVSQLEAHQSERARYQLCKVGVIGDFFAYQLRPAAELPERIDEPPHLICQPCLDIRQQKSILRATGIYCICDTCNRKVQVKPEATPTPLPVIRL